MKNKIWLTGPATFTGCLIALIMTWTIVTPETLINCFDRNGYSPVELATIPLFAAVLPLVWWKCPFTGPRHRRTILCLAVCIVAMMAIVKELDLHNQLLHWTHPDFVSADGSINATAGLVKPNGSELTGTPFKMRVLTNCGVPLSMKGIILAYFILFFGVFAVTFAYLGVNWLRGVFLLDAAAWAWGCCGVSGLVVQIADRLPAWLNHAYGLENHTDGGVSSMRALCTCLEEGGEMMLALLALITIFLGWRKRVS